jgi:hypothetical protein
MIRDEFKIQIFLVSFNFGRLHSRFEILDFSVLLKLAINDIELSKVVWVDEAEAEKDAKTIKSTA